MGRQKSDQPQGAETAGKRQGNAGRKYCEKCGSEIVSTKHADLCEDCKGQQLQDNVKKGVALAAVVAAGAKVAIPKVAPYAKKAAPAVIKAVKNLVLR